MGRTSIEWTDENWNPVRGCSRVSEGCRNCYAERQAIRQKHAGYSGFVTILNGHPAWTGRVELITPKLTAPLHWKKPRRIFVNTMSDLFHEGLPDFDVAQVFRSIARADWHTYQILTKRSKRMLDLVPHIWKTFGQLQHVWLGVSVENRGALSRIDDLRQTPAAVRFLSIEPLLEDLGKLDLTGIALGHRRRRVRAGRQADGSAVGAIDSRSVPGRRDSVLLQTMGRMGPEGIRRQAGHGQTRKESRGPPARWARMERVSRRARPLTMPLLFDTRSRRHSRGGNGMHYVMLGAAALVGPRPWQPAAIKPPLARPAPAVGPRRAAPPPVPKTCANCALYFPSRKAWGRHFTWCLSRREGAD